MSLHYNTFAWVDAALERGEITHAEYDVLVYCCHKVLWNRGGWDEMRVPAYSAAQVCRFYGEDADEKNRQRYKRAWSELRQRYVLCHDYKRGIERTYNVWLPLSDPFAVAQELRISLYTPMSQLLVPAPVPPMESASDTQHEASQQKSPLMSQPVSQLCPSNLSLNNQSERESPSVPQGGDTQLPLGCAQTPHGLRKSTPAQGTAKATPLTADQCKKLDAIVSAFRTAWAKHYTFDPSAEDARKLLRTYCPLEIFFAYEHLRAEKKKLTNNFTSVFFNRTAANTICERRKSSDIDAEIGFVYPIPQLAQCVYMGEGLDFGFDFDSTQTAWCELFGVASPLFFWMDYESNVHIHSYDLKNFQRELAQKAAAEKKRIDDEAAAEKKRPADEQRQREATEQKERYKAEAERRQAEFAQQQKTQRANLVESITQRFSSSKEKWTFDGESTWTAPYKVTVRLTADIGQAEVIGTKGNVRQYPTRDVEKLWDFAVSID